ncbi:hypothetical protein POP12_178 [Pectobacterium phage POP12]|nr:hypothetical protein POP12_178 [Pectobacterium phage POP12]
MINMPANHYLNLALDKVANLQGGIDYCMEALSSELELWERKEYTSILQTKQEELLRAKEHLEYMKTL